MAKNWKNKIKKSPEVRVSKRQVATLCHLFVIISPSHLLPLKCFLPFTYTLPEPFTSYLHSLPILSPLLSSSIEACHHDASPLRVLFIISMYYVLRCVINFIMDPQILCHCVFQNFGSYINFKPQLEEDAHKHNRVEKSLQLQVLVASNGVSIYNEVQLFKSQGAHFFSSHFL